MSLATLLARISPRIFAPKGLPTAERLDRLFLVQQRSLIACMVVNGIVAVLAIFASVIGGLTFDRATLIVLVMIIEALLLTIRHMMMATQLWRTMATRIQNDSFELHSNYVRLVTQYQEVSKIPDAITMVPEGWLFSFGVMNVSRHNQPHRTGPTAFLWRSDVVLKNGKVESRAVTGEGETLEQALLDAIKQAREISYPPVPA